MSATSATLQTDLSTAASVSPAVTVASMTQIPTVQFVRWLERLKEVSSVPDGLIEEMECAMKNESSSPLAVASAVSEEEDSGRKRQHSEAFVSCLSEDEEDATRGGAKQNEDENEDDEIEVTEAPEPILEPAAAAAAASSRTTGDDDEIEEVGQANVTHLPHNRQDCLEHRYDEGGEAAANASFCDLCYCYVCDKKASECDNWISDSGDTDVSKNHCRATDRGGDKHTWRRMREMARNGGSVPATNVQSAIEQHQQQMLLHFTQSTRMMAQRTPQRTSQRQVGRRSSTSESPTHRRVQRSPRRTHRDRIRTQSMLEDLYK